MRCHFCDEEGERFINACHWTGSEYVRVDVCHAARCREQIASAPRRPRRKRKPMLVDAGGWAAIPGLNRMLAGK